ncbi:hypothetical protein DFH09DRAFT_1080093 [Mycena vulgaris]|nr:hypothetical protein DFH09DRAFT_1080093 [Mycena vulgaris]
MERANTGSGGKAPPRTDQKSSGRKPAPASRPSTRTTPDTSSNMHAGKSREELYNLSAIDWFVDRAKGAEDCDPVPSLDTLALVLLRAAAATSLSVVTADAMRAVAYFLEGHRAMKTLAEVANDVKQLLELAKAPRPPVANTEDDEEVAQSARSAVVVLTRTVEQQCNDLWSLTARLEDNVKEVERRDASMRPYEDPVDVQTGGEPPNVPAARSYAGAVAASAAAPQANLALDIAIKDLGDNTTPTKTAFVGARKNGCVCQGAWLRFWRGWEFVPVSFDPELGRAFEVIEDANGLDRGALVQARFIKPPARRHPGQRSAHAIFGFASAASANHVIRHSLFVDGRRVVGTNHTAATCPSIHDVCARCGEMHRTDACTKGDEERACANCRAAKRTYHGHGAADCSCPSLATYSSATRARTFDDALMCFDPRSPNSANNKVQFALERNPDAKYRFFPTDDPESWEGIGDVVHTNQDATWQNGNAWGGGVAHSDGRSRGAPKPGLSRQAAAGIRVGMGAVDAGWSGMAQMRQTTLDEVVKEPEGQNVSSAPAAHDAGGMGSTDVNGRGDTSPATRSRAASTGDAHDVLTDLNGEEEGDGDDELTPEEQIKFARHERLRAERLTRSEARAAAPPIMFSDDGETPNAGTPAGGDARRLRLWQQNLNKSLRAQLDMLQSLKPARYDIALLQEPSRTNVRFTAVYPTPHVQHPELSRSLILVNTLLPSSSWSQIPLDSSDFTGVELSGEFGIIQVINHPIHEEARVRRRIYAGAVDDAKTSHWVKWLESLDVKDVWAAGRLVSGPPSDGGRARVPTLRVVDPVTHIVTEATSNEAKSKLFYKEFFPAKMAISSVPPNPVYPAPALEMAPISDALLHRVIARMKPYKATREGSFVNVWNHVDSIVLRKPGKPNYTDPFAFRPVVLSKDMARLYHSLKTAQLTISVEHAGLLPVVFCWLWLQARSHASQAMASASQATAWPWLELALASGLKYFKPEPGQQARA